MALASKGSWTPALELGSSTLLSPAPTADRHAGNIPSPLELARKEPESRAAFAVSAHHKQVQSLHIIAWASRQRLPSGSPPRLNQLLEINFSDYKNGVWSRSDTPRHSPRMRGISPTHRGELHLARP